MFEPQTSNLTRGPKEHLFTGASTTWSTMNFVERYVFESAHLVWAIFTWGSDSVSPEASHLPLSMGLWDSPWSKHGGLSVSGTTKSKPANFDKGELKPLLHSPFPQALIPRSSRPNNCRHDKKCSSTLDFFSRPSAT